MTILASVDNIERVLEKNCLLGVFQASQNKTSGERMVLGEWFLSSL